MSRTVRGLAAAPGVAAGFVQQWGRVVAGVLTTTPLADRQAMATSAGDALDAAVVELETIAARLRADGRVDEAEIIEAGALMGDDPSLRAAVSSAALRDGVSAPAAILAATDAAAATLEALGDDLLSARAADVRSLGARASRLAAGGIAHRDHRDGAVLVAGDLGPADVVELDGGVRAVVLASGGVSAHAAIVARSLGIPMVVGAGAAMLEVPDGAAVIVDGAAGSIVVDPDDSAITAVERATADRLRLAERVAAARDLPAVTVDGRRVRLLANVAGMSELAMAFDAGAEGVGLLRTELAFLDAVAWPSVEEHRRLLDPLLARLAGCIATVRILDFGGDKTPPFLDGTGERGITLLRSAPQALAAQLEAILRAGAGTQLRVLVPMVVGREDVLWVRDMIDTIMSRDPELTRPLLGAMIEVPAAVSMLPSIAPAVDLLSIGTNDLAHLHLGVDRSGPRAPAHHPAVLRLVDAVAQAARDAHVVVEVCGEAASDPVAMPLLVGLGVDELSVGAARVGEVRSRIRELSYATAARAAQQALSAENVAEVEAAVASL